MNDDMDESLDDVAEVTIVEVSDTPEDSLSGHLEFDDTYEGTIAGTQVPSVFGSEGKGS